SRRRPSPRCAPQLHTCDGASAPWDRSASDLVFSRFPRSGGLTVPRVGTGRVYQRGNIWWIDYSFRGKRHQESSKSTKKSDATKLLRKRLAEMGRGQLVGPDAERVMFEDLARGIRDD